MLRTVYKANSNRDNYYDKSNNFDKKKKWNL